VNARQRLVSSNVAVAFAWLLAIPTAEYALASGCAPDNPEIAVSTSAVFNITSTSLPASDLNTAAAYWSGCGAGADIPAMQIGGSGGVPVSVTLVAGSSPTGRCGRADVHVGANSRRVVAVDITVYTRQNNGSSCQPFSDEVAHELGHALGLNDADSAACRQHIMGFRDLGTRRSVGGEDCDQVDQNWQLPDEPAESETPGGGLVTPCV
jgi:hypothetical protein